MASDVSLRSRRLVAEPAYHVCEYCLIHEDDAFWGCQVDHVISRRHGGGSEGDNLAWACGLCNNNKGTDLGTRVGKPSRLVRLFHPRKDRWTVCFRLEGVRIESSNSIGAATEKLLKLNEENRLHERDVLAQSGRFPTIEALARMKE